MTPSKARFIILSKLTLRVVGAWVATSKENKTATNLAWLFLRPIWPSRIPLTMYFDGTRTLKRKWRQFVIFFSLLAFCPFYPTAGLLPDHELREVLQSRKITILGSKSIKDLKQPLEAVKKGRRGPRGIIEWVEATTPSLFSPTLKISNGTRKEPQN